MSTLSGIRIVLVVLSLGPLAAWSHQQPALATQQPTMCASLVPPEYLAYHALVAPQAALSERRAHATGCAPRKEART